jgi:predicted enzyme related to lactoylglutathione lyase
LSDDALATCDRGGVGVRQCAPPAAPVAGSEEAAVTRTNNHIDYVEFSAPDLNAVKSFYEQAFGWTFQDWGPDYVAFSGAGIEGGFRGGETPSASGALVILYADDLEASERAVIAAGGEVVARHEFPGGRRFHFRDPAGNVLGVWTAIEGGG